MITFRSVAMKQLLSDFAAMAQPGYWIALGLLFIPYEVGAFFPREDLPLHVTARVMRS